MTWAESTIINALQQILTLKQASQSVPADLWNQVIAAWEKRPLEECM